MEAILRSLTVLLIVAFTWGVMRPRLAQAASATVTIQNFSFQPSSLSVNQGDTVTWVQKDSTLHNSQSDSGLWSGPLLSLNQTFSHTFSSAGVFPYHCVPHASFMKASITVNASLPANQPPVVSISSPANGATVTGPNVTIVASASDPDGSVAQVQFFEGRTSLGTASSAPFQVTVPLAAGPHNLSAQATDNQGAVASSAVVSVTVTVAAPPVSQPTLSGPARTADGKFQFTVQATAGQTYIVEISSDLQTWQTIQTIPATSATFTVTDTPPAGSARFYRVGVQQ